MKRLFLLLLLTFFSGVAFSQTTVNLADQCNCEVLSGTAVTAPGMTSPTGADTGDIYVNTNSGTIYYWDGDSWELTSTDSNTTNTSFAVVGADLVLTDSDGNSVSVPLADLGAINTDDQTLTLSGNTLSIENANSVDLSGYLDNTDNQNAAQVAFDNTASGLAATTVQDAIDEINAAAGTV
ncbi:hypothetical protein OZ410_00005, partial [Robiginitalea sp. M366]|uniref:hypothetical protein n=1 Tax=Robiginitalea aestuariiviva TaxID=3036903 RepID=UPI00240CF0ED